MPPASHCRFYEAPFPEVDDVVMVSVRSIQDMGAYVHLLEYNGIEGMILLSELSRRRIRSINKLVRVGRNECVVVLRVDKEKGYIDLSKRRVSAEEIKKCEEKYNKAKAVHSILRHVADTMKYDLQTLYEKTVWKLERQASAGAGSSYDALKLAITDQPQIFDQFDLEDGELKKALIDNIRHRLTPQAVKIRTDIDVSCYAYEGINAIKAALHAGLALSTAEQPISINLIAPPKFVMTTTSLDKDQGVQLLEKATDAIRDAIEESGGELSVSMSPRAVTDADDKDLAEMLKELAVDNEPVEGDGEGPMDAEEQEGMGSVDVV